MIKVKIMISVWIAMFFFWVLNSNLTAAEKIFRAGTACVDVSPTVFPVIVNGGFLPIYATKLNDPLYVRAIAFDSGSDHFVFAAVDNCLMPTEMAEKIKKLAAEKCGWSTDKMSISTTHCHSAPALMGVHASEPDPHYIKELPSKAADAIAKAVANLRPVVIGWGTIKEPRFVFCRRFLMKSGTAAGEPSPFTGVRQDLAMMNPGRKNPNIISRTAFPDQTVYVLAAKTLDGRPYAVLANYSTHYAGAPQVSADYFGVFAKKTAQLLNAPDHFVAMMTNGTSGDTNCCDFLRTEEEQGKYNSEIVGCSIAEDVLKIWRSLEFKNWVPLKTEQKEMTLKIRKPSQKDVDEAKKYLAQLKKEKKPIRTRTDVYARETLIDNELPGERTIKIQAVRIGGVGIGTIPGELYSFTGHDLRAYSPFTPTFLISLSNGYNGYIPTLDAFEVGGYTTWRTRSSILEREAEPKIRAQLLQMLKNIDKK